MGSRYVEKYRCIDPKKGKRHVYNGQKRKKIRINSQSLTETLKQKMYAILKLTILVT